MPIRRLAHGKYHYDRAAESILGLVLFNIFVLDLFPFITNSQILNCTVYNSLLCYSKKIDAAHEKLKLEFKLIT